MWTKAQEDAAWNKCRTIEGKDHNLWRLDFADAIIRRDHISLRGAFGWRVTMLKPKEMGGTTDNDNLIAAQWRNSRMKVLTGSYPKFKSIITNDGEFRYNVERVQDCTVEEIK